MVKESGLGMTVSIDDSAGVLKDLSNDISDLSFSTPQGLQTVTGLDKSAVERLILLSDGSVQITGPAFNDATDHFWAVFKTRTGVRTVTILISGQTLSMEMLIEDVTWTRGSDGSMGGKCSLQLQSGIVPVWS